MSSPVRAFALAAALLAAALAPAALRAQVEERPVAFDSAQRLTAITPMLATRLKLAPPAWPVTGEFREAKLYAAGDQRVVVVERPDGTLVRYPLDAAQWAALEAAVAQGMRVAGNPGGEPGAYAYTEIAGTRFARKQLVYGLLLYGPILASFSDDGNTAGSLYLAGAALPSLVSLAYARDGALTRAQADLGMAGSLRGAMLGVFAYNALAKSNAGEFDNGNADGITVLAGSAVMSAGGLVLGRGLTDGEAKSMIEVADYGLATTAGLMGAFGAWDRNSCRVETQAVYDPQSGTYEPVPTRLCESKTSQGEWGSLFVGGLVGYPLGLAYVRKSSYAVTAGDASTLLVPAGIGILTGAAFVGDDASRRARYTAMTGGLVAGLVAGDRLLVKPFDFTRSQATALRVGGIGGGLLGMAATTGSDDGRIVAASAAAGGALGAWIAYRSVHPRRVGDRAPLREARRDGATDGAPDEPTRAARVAWSLDPAGLAMAAARTPGRHGILSLTF